MNSIEQKKIKDLLSQCKSELLNHTVQNEVVSPSIKNIKLCLDECLTFLEAENTPPEIIYRNPRNSRSPRVYGEERENILFIAYCMSKLDYHFVNKITGECYNQTKAFTFLAQKLKINPLTLRNYRDAFDHHVKQLHSNRIGWRRELAPDLEKVKEKCHSFTESKLTGYAKDILKIC